MIKLWLDDVRPPPDNTWTRVLTAPAAIEFLQRNGYREVGNDYVAPQREEFTRSDRVSDIRRALGD